MRKLICLCLVFTVAALGGLVAARNAASSGDWKAVKEAMEKRRPQTAIQELEPIVKRTLQAQDHDEATKAIALQVMLESQIQGGKAEERITRLESRMKELPEPMRPMMEVVLANWYWTFFQQNKWRFVQRTQTDQPPGDDILSWDLPRILSEIDSHFQAALEAEKWLQDTPVSEFDELLTEGSMPDSYRPTLFDFVVYDALKFYSAGEQAGAAAQDAYVLQAASPILSPPGDFLAWKIESTDTDSPTLKAIRLYQRLMRFHKANQRDMALAEADLSRLKFGYNKAFGEEKNARYKAALTGFVEHWKNEPISARALAAHAEVLRSERLLVDAHRLAERGWKAFPESVGGKQCYNLIQDIEAREIDVRIERVWNNPWPSIVVDYRNLTEIHFRAVRYDWEELIGRANHNPGRVDGKLREEVLGKEPDLEWSRDLPPTEDYLSKEATFEVPDHLEPGFYFLIASPDSEFREQDNRVLAQEFFVSPLALVLRTGTTGSVEGFVLHADTGEPIEGARVRPWLRKRVVREYNWVEQSSVKTDADGQFRVDGPSRESYAILVEHDGYAISSHNQVRGHGRREESKPFERTVFFTDRSLYRPGQTIRFKGIRVSVDQQRDNYETIEGKSVTVVFEDANGEKISEQECRTNAFGSFSGSFTAPRDRLTGRMVLRDATDRGSQTHVSVEEYKRPKFKVELESPEEAAQLGAKVHVPGIAKAYTGAAIGNAQVEYRVVREVRYPIWWRWRCWWNPPRSEAQEIAHGSTTTESDGSFTVPFTARPEPSVSEKDEPTFRFTVHADVTDTTGETRSDQRAIQIAYTSLQASMSTDDWLVAGEEVKIR
ncbi:MAG: MG2 domain-containing protein, partial [Pirellulaceae bacterium]